jgi:hypothetical protein
MEMSSDSQLVVHEWSRGVGCYTNTTEMSKFLYLYPFCTVISTIASLLSIGYFPPNIQLWINCFNKCVATVEKNYGLKILPGGKNCTIFWDITPCLSTASRWLLARLILRPWRWRRYVPPKRRLTFNGLHGVISQKMVLFDSTLRLDSKILNFKIC